jgi:hypothetical protein
MQREEFLEEYVWNAQRILEEFGHKVGAASFEGALLVRLYCSMSCVQIGEAPAHQPRRGKTEEWRASVLELGLSGAEDALAQLRDHCAQMPHVREELPSRARLGSDWCLMVSRHPRLMQAFECTKSE